MCCDTVLPLCFPKDGKKSTNSTHLISRSVYWQCLYTPVDRYRRRQSCHHEWHHLDHCTARTWLGFIFILFKISLVDLVEFVLCHTASKISNKESVCVCRCLIIYQWMYQCSSYVFDDYFGSQSFALKGVVHGNRLTSDCITQHTDKRRKVLLSYSALPFLSHLRKLWRQSKRCRLERSECCNEFRVN